MLYKINLEHILFLDIESVPLHQNFDEVDGSGIQLWE